MSSNNVAVTVVVNKDLEVLILKRAPGTRSFPGFWNFPGGGVEEDESIKDAAVRELLEEAGLQIDGDELIPIYYTQFSAMDLFVFIIQADGDVKINDESTDFKWIKFSEVDDYKFIPLSDELRNEIKFYVGELWKK